MQLSMSTLGRTSCRGRTRGQHARVSVAEQPQSGASTRVYDRAIRTDAVWHESPQNRHGVQENLFRVGNGYGQNRPALFISAAMKLADYLYRTGMSTSHLRRALGLSTRSAISRYLHGERTPQPTVMQKIIELTGGQVQLRDFLTPGNPECATVITLPNGRKRLVFPWSGRDRDLVAATAAEAKRLAANDGLSEPVHRAVVVLAGRARVGPGGRWLLDERPVDHRGLVREANRVLAARNRPAIAYPGLASS